MKPLFSSEKLLKSVAAFILSAMIGATLIAATLTILSLRLSIEAFFWSLSATFIIVLFHLLVIGLPVQFILQKLKLTDYFTNTVAATICVAGCYAFYGLYDLYGDREGSVPAHFDVYDLADPSYLQHLGLCAVVGLVIATPAWLFRRPDLDNLLVTKRSTLKAVP